MPVPLLSDEGQRQDAEHDKSLHSVAVTTKLTEGEAEALNAYAARKGIGRSEAVRNAVLAAMQGTPPPSEPSVELTEIVGLRLLLINLLKPQATGEKLTLEGIEKISRNAKSMKREIASAIAAGEKD